MLVPQVLIKAPSHCRASSIRTPSGFCGIYGLRPSYNRLPYTNCRNSLEGQESAPSVLGPMAPTLSALKLFMTAIIGAEPWRRDPLVIRKRWSEDDYHLREHGEGKGSLCFGMIWHDDYAMPHPPVLRALEETKQALIRAGRKVVDWKPLKHKEIHDVIVGSFYHHIPASSRLTALSKSAKSLQQDQQRTLRASAQKRTSHTFQACPSTKNSKRCTSTNPLKSPTTRRANQLTISGRSRSINKR